MRRALAWMGVTLALIAAGVGAAVLLAPLPPSPPGPGTGEISRENTGRPAKAK